MIGNNIAITKAILYNANKKINAIKLYKKITLDDELDDYCLFKEYLNIINELKDVKLLKLTINKGKMEVVNA